MADDSCLAVVPGDHVDWDRDDWIRHYYGGGYSNKEILAILYTRHAITLSIRHLKRLLARMGLKRREVCAIGEVVDAVQYEIQGSARDLGYRSMQTRLRTQHGIIAARDLVMDVVRVLDPEAVERRMNRVRNRRQYHNRGPNYLIHMDGFDKLKPFGLAVHGAICGFSRRVVWLRVASSNNNPRYVAQFYVDYLREIKGVPRCIRADRGTENVTVADIQRGLRINDEDEMAGEKSFLFGTSPANQRIERWWRTVQEMGLSFWRDEMKDLRDSGDFDCSDEVHICCLRFCCMQLLQEELNRIRKDWNEHRVRRNSRAECPPGKPDMLYYLPENVGSFDYKIQVDEDIIDTIEEEFCSKPSPTGCEDMFAERCSNIIRHAGKEMPVDCHSAVQLYRWLLHQL